MESGNSEEGGEIDVLSGVETIIGKINEERNSKRLLGDICGEVLNIFQGDRAWLLFPCDPESHSWSVPVEQAVPEFPGACSDGLAIEMTPDVAEIFQAALDSDSPVVYGPGGLPLAENTKGFGVKSQLSMAIYPRIGKPWQFGIHQCSRDRVWTKAEIRLFQIIGVLTAEALGNILLFRNLHTANETLEQRVDERTAELNAEKNFAESLIETAQAIVLLLDTGGRIVRFNPYMEEISGYRLEEVKGSDWFDTFLPVRDRERIRGVFHSALQGIRPKGNVNPIVAKDGQERVIEWYGKALMSPQGEVAGLLAVGHDVTERVRIEEQIRASLQEKNVLLREIHHRVKNNMQVVTSLIGIQRSQLQAETDPAMLTAFVETEKRINSMALVHERLYRSKNFAHVEFGTYIEQLAEDLFRTYGVNADKVALDTRIENLEININHAIPCGLIVNELLSNALKYAFADGRNGKIRVTLRSVEGSMRELSVCDDGIGLPPDFSIEHAETMGMMIVHALVQQISADIVVSGDDGTCVQIRFGER